MGRPEFRSHCSSASSSLWIVVSTGAILAPNPWTVETPRISWFACEFVDPSAIISVVLNPALQVIVTRDACEPQREIR